MSILGFQAVRLSFRHQAKDASPGDRGLSQWQTCELDDVVLLGMQFAFSDLVFALAALVR